VLKEQLTKLHNIIDTYKPLRYRIEKEFNARPVTNAWMKYWEIYHQYDLIPTTSKFTAFFNAELPGAALCALNHYMKTVRPRTDFKWYASSLAPQGVNDPAALGDTYGIYANNKDNWLMSIGDNAAASHSKHTPTNNGDATVLGNLLDFAARIGPESTVGGVDLYSHDAGIDVSDDFNNQELSNSRVHLGCAIAGFLTLKIGGAFVAKQYTYFEAFTWNLICIYACMFDEFYLCKPLTSRPYNSEIYLVGKGFKGMSNTIYTLLTDRLTNFNTSPFIQSEHIDVQPTDALTRFARIIFGQQTSMMAENIGFINEYRTNLNVLRDGLDEFKRDRARHWLGCYPVTRIDSQDNISSNIQ
jgi:hypothetical protein